MSVAGPVGGQGRGRARRIVEGGAAALRAVGDLPVVVEVGGCGARGSARGGSHPRRAPVEADTGARVDACVPPRGGERRRAGHGERAGRQLHACSAGGEHAELVGSVAQAIACREVQQDALSRPAVLPLGLGDEPAVEPDANAAHGVWHGEHGANGGAGDAGPGTRGGHVSEVPHRSCAREWNGIVVACGTPMRGHGDGVASRSQGMRPGAQHELQPVAAAATHRRPHSPPVEVHRIDPCAAPAGQHDTDGGRGRRHRLRRGGQHPDQAGIGGGPGGTGNGHGGEDGEGEGLARGRWHTEPSGGGSTIPDSVARR